MDFVNAGVQEGFFFIQEAERRMILIVKAQLKALEPQKSWMLSSPHENSVYFLVINFGTQ